MGDSRTVRGRAPGPATGRRRDRQRLATVDVHGTVPGAGTMRRAGEIFAMQPAARDGARYEEQ